MSYKQITPPLPRLTSGILSSTVNALISFFVGVACFLISIGWRYGPYELAYKDKLTLTSNSIAYEYVPEQESEKNSSKKWKYSTNSPEFKIIFDRLSQAVETVFSGDLDSDLVTDVGFTELLVTYSDKTKNAGMFWTNGEEYFIELGASEYDYHTSDLYYYALRYTISFWHRCFFRTQPLLIGFPALRKTRSGASSDTDAKPCTLLTPLV